MSIRLLVACVMVSLIACVACPQGADGAVLFSDDFENAASFTHSSSGTWSSYNTGPNGPENYMTGNGGTVTITSNQHVSGSHALQCSWQAGDYAVGLIKNNIPGVREVYFRYYVKYEPGFDSNWPTEEKFAILYGDNRAQRLGIYQSYSSGPQIGGPYFSFASSTEYDLGGDMENVFIVMDEASGEHGTNYSAWRAWNPTVGQWYCMEWYVKIHPTGGQVRVWIDGVEKEIWNKGALFSWWINPGVPYRCENIPLGDNDFDELHISTQNNQQASTKDIWFDDVVVSTTYVGPIDGGPQPLTFNNISVSPSTVSANEGYNTSVISFTASKSLATPPTVVIDNSYQATLESQDGLNYSFSYVADGTEVEGSHVITISGTDADGNQGEDTSAQLEFDFTEPSPPSGLSVN